MSPLALLLAATAACAALQLLLWLVALRIRNWSLVDPGWAACLVLAALLYAGFASGLLERRLLVAGLVLLWGGRHVLLLLLTRVIGRPEEGRYVELRARWSAAGFLVFFQAQALLAALLSAAFLLAAARTEPLGALDAAGASLFALAFAGEALADAQLARWKADPANRGRTCRAGLWSWSRHPNYFFEVLIWVAFALPALGAAWGALALLAPALLLVLILFVTGIPPTEAQALRSRGEDYRAYQREVSVLVPWPPRGRRPA